MASTHNFSLGLPPGNFHLHDGGMSTLEFPRTYRGSRAPSVFTAALPPSARSSPQVHERGSQPGHIAVSVSDAHLADLVRDRIQAAGFAVAESPGGSTGQRVLARVADAASLASTHRPSSEPLLMVSAEAPSRSDLLVALEHRALAVRALPEGTSDFLADLTSLTETEHAHTIACIPGSGGAGASSLAARLAGAAARLGHATSLVDLDASGGGLDTLVEASHVRGTRWNELASAGAGNGDIIRDSLPTVDGVHLLTFPTPGTGTARTTPSPAVVSALMSVPGVVVLDAPRERAVLDTIRPDHTLLVVAGTDHGLRAAAQTARLLSGLPSHASVGVALRHMRGHVRLDARDVEDALQLPLALEFSSYGPGIVPLLDLRRRGADSAALGYIREAVGAP